MFAPVLFVAVFTIDGWLRPGYHPVSMFVSELSLGAGGWVQIANFLVTGALLVLFGRGLAAWLRSGPAATAGPVLLQVSGASLVVSAPFRTDPSAMFDQVSVHGTVHGIAGAVFFSLAPVTCLVFYRRLRMDPALRALAPWTLAAAVALVAGIALLKMSQMPGDLFAYKGLTQRAILIVYMAWLFALAHLARTHPTSSRDPAPPDLHPSTSDR